MLNFFDLRFAYDALFYSVLGSQTMRHAASNAVQGCVEYTKKAFAGYEALCADKDSFLALLDAAIANPRGPEARVALKKIMPIFNLMCGAPLRAPWRA